MKVVLIIAAAAVAVLLLLVAVTVIVGSRLPKDHVASRSVILQAAPADVYRIVTDFASAPTWRRDLKQIELLGEVDGRMRFREHGRHGAVTYEIVQLLPGQLLVTQIVDRDLGYSGSWTYAFVAEGTGTRLTITERGEVSNVVFRFLSRFVFGHAGTIEKYLSALSAHIAARGKV